VLREGGFLLLAFLGVLLVGGSLFYVAYKIQMAAESSAAEDRLNLNWSDSSSEDRKFNPPIYLKLTKPFLKGGPLLFASGLWSPKAIEKWKKKIISAGLRKHIEPEHFVASKFWFAFEATIVAILLVVFAETPPSPFLIVGLIAGAFFLPNMQVNSLREQRQFEIRISMPFVVDLLTLSIEAGLDFMGAISKVVDRAPHGPFIEELSVLLKDIQLGKSRAEAMKEMADRIDMMEMSSFVAILVSSDQMGASIGQALRGQSDSMRSERMSRAEKLGAQASQKILIPLVIFILPATMLMIFGPIVVGFFTN
jgi:tight adherence protein C